VSLLQIFAVSEINDLMTSTACHLQTVVPAKSSSKINLNLDA